MNKIIESLSIFWGFKSRLPLSRRVRRKLYHQLGAPAGCTVVAADSVRQVKTRTRVTRGQS